MAAEDVGAAAGHCRCCRARAAGCRRRGPSRCRSSAGSGPCTRRWCSGGSQPWLAASSIWSLGRRRRPLRPCPASTWRALPRGSCPCRRRGRRCTACLPSRSGRCGTAGRTGRDVGARADAMYCRALAAVRVKRGSTTIILAPFPWRAGCAASDTGCASAAFEPMNSTPWRSACRCRSSSSRRSPRCSPRPPRWWSGRCAPGGRCCWCPRGDELAQQVGLLVVVFRRSDEIHRVGAGLLADLQQAVADLVERPPQEIFWYLPSTSFIGYPGGIHRGRARAGAPLAQCAPRLIGESNTGPDAPTRRCAHDGVGWHSPPNSGCTRCGGPRPCPRRATRPRAPRRSAAPMKL